MTKATNAGIIASALLLLGLSFAGCERTSASAEPTVAPVAAPTVAQAVLDLGATVYRQQRCRVCHSIAGEGGKHSLDGTGSRLAEAEVRKWIVAPKEMDPKVRKRAYTKLAEDELAALVAYMMSLK